MPKSFLAWLPAVLLLSVCSIPAAERRPAVTDYAGRWVNVEAHTRYITHIEITAQNAGTSAVQMHVWGKCQPRDCDWGMTAATFRSGKVSAIWKQGDGRIKHELSIEADGRLKLRSEAQFSDRAGRQEERSVTYFIRENGP